MAKKRSAPTVSDCTPLSWIHESLRPLAEPLAKLVPDPRNARKHDADNVSAIAASLKVYGQRKPIVANRANGHIEAGNGTYLAAQQLGWTHLAVVWVEDDPTAQRGFAIADNRTAELANWDEAVLEELLAEVENAHPDLYADLLLDELRQVEEKEPEEKQRRADPPTAAYQVIVECTDVKDRRRVLQQLRKEGRKCRALTWR